MPSYPLSNLVEISSPSAEPLCLAEVKAHLRVDYDDDDDLVIAPMIRAARDTVEKKLSRALVNRVYDYYFDQFPGIPPYPRADYIELPRPPLVEVTNFTYIDSTGTLHQWTSSGNDLVNETGVVNAHVDTVNEPGRIVLAYSQVWPTEVLKTTTAVRIRYTAGFGDPQDVPEVAKSAMKFLIATWYRDRESTVVGRYVTSSRALDTLELLLEPMRNWNFA